MTSLRMILVISGVLLILFLTGSYNELFGLVAAMLLTVMLITFGALTLFANPNGNRRKLIRNIIISIVFPAVLLLFLQPIAAIILLVAVGDLLRRIPSSNSDSIIVCPLCHGDTTGYRVRFGFGCPKCNDTGKIPAALA